MSVDEILKILEHEFGSPRSELDYDNVFELLIAVTLSAQATDVSVNQVTPRLFEKYPDPESLSKADLKDVEDILRSLGLYRKKAEFIVATSQQIVERFGGEVPSNRKDLMSLPGVGRKTANVVLSEGFGIPAIAVDTHVSRVAKRLGWADQKASVLEVEKNLMNLIDEKDWAKSHHLLLLFGRYHSTARDKRDIYDVLNELKEKHQL